MTGWKEDMARSCREGIDRRNVGARDLRVRTTLVMPSIVAIDVMDKKSMHITCVSCGLAAVENGAPNFTRARWATCFLGK